MAYLSAGYARARGRALGSRFVEGKSALELGAPELMAVPVVARRPRLDWLDVALIVIFLIGLYTNYTIMVSQKVPFPSIPSGVAGLAQTLFPHRLEAVTSGNDPSFFYRVQGPALAGC